LSFGLAGQLSSSLFNHAPFYACKIEPLLERFPMGTRHIMVKNLIIVPFLIDASIDELRYRTTLWFPRFLRKIVLAAFSSQFLASLRQVIWLKNAINLEK
jgi:hypothetical protein